MSRFTSARHILSRIEAPVSSSILKLSRVLGPRYRRISTTASHVYYVDMAGNVVHCAACSFRFAAYSGLHRALSETFGSARYHLAHEVTGFKDEHDAVWVEFTDGQCHLCGSPRLRRRRELRLSSFRLPITCRPPGGCGHRSVAVGMPAVGLGEGVIAAIAACVSGVIAAVIGVVGRLLV